MPAADARPSPVPSRLSLDEVEPALREQLAPRVERLGYFGEFFAVLAHQPVALASLLQLADASKSELPVRFVEVAGLSVARSIGAPYEQFQHEHVARAKGLPAEWIAEVLADAPGPTMSSDDRRMREISIAVASGAPERLDTPLRELASAHGDACAAAALLVAGYYTMVCQIERALSLESPVPSIFEAS